jgi:hypothetical protein
MQAKLGRLERINHAKFILTIKGFKCGSSPPYRGSFQAPYNAIKS